MHAISKFANIITHGYNVCELKCREEWLTVNGKYKKIEIYLFRYSAIPLFRYSVIPYSAEYNFPNCSLEDTPKGTVNILKL